ncbi:phage baseplate assembly protein V [Bartonella krasnovii]|uniref:phage baseplate assembly protein V n=1 Tax=Bartonella krasnovii TaxID=2267275 RepID=UPI001F4D0BA5|nr:phage baseplate assembly protein V [Bartonella krasnovii]UNF39101.1 phage baseplate assembly protein V [Bartonella krasnovii]UNF44110.1 phage baseplate assembly protein V [Bartonella krasnovii]UNF47296.1 phage baseplate assembly protein V [Bartonella krasnovii]UNF50642.1 phage baseplate assembly protein V [Bartonella krasnovii]
MLERRDKEITDLKRRVANMVVVGKISHVDHKNARYRVKSGSLISDWIPDTQARAGKTRSYEGRDVGEQVVVISSSGDLSQGVIVGSIHTDANQAADKGSIHRTIYPDGTSLEYNDEQNTYGIHIKSSGKFILTIADGVSLKGDGGKLELTAPEGIKIVSESDINLNAKGSISLKAGGGVSLNSNDSLSLHSGNNVSIHSSGLKHNGTNVGATHVHGGVSPGGAMTGGPK